jgi:hypothetical protein
MIPDRPSPDGSGILFLVILTEEGSQEKDIADSRK